MEILAPRIVFERKEEGRKMDFIAIGVIDSSTTSQIIKIVRDLGLRGTLEFATNVDIEVRAGLKLFADSFDIECLIVLTKAENDTDSNLVTQEAYDDLLHGRISVFQQLAIRLVESSLTPLWLVFAYTWESDTDVTYYVGDKSDLSAYLKLNCGAYRTTHSLAAKATNIDIDTPLIWKLVA